MTTLTDKFNQAGTTEAGVVANLPDTGATTRKRRKPDPLVGVVKSLNENRDLNTTHDFDFWIARDSELNDVSAFNGIHAKVLANRSYFNNFSGDPKVDFTNLSPAEIQFYSDFLGINFKKIGHALGSAATSVGHAARGVALTTAHAVRDVSVDVAHGARYLATGAVHGVADLGTDVGHVTRDAALDVAHAARTAEQQGIKHLEKQWKDTENIVKAIAPYYRTILPILAMVALAFVPGVGWAADAAIGSALFAGLNAIPRDQPQLPADFGSGGSMGDNGEGSGFPLGDGDYTDDDGNPEDNGEGLTIQDQQNMRAQAQAANEQQLALEQAAAHKKKLIMWGAGIIGTIILIWFIRRK